MNNSNISRRRFLTRFTFGLSGAILVPQYLSGCSGASSNGVSVADNELLASNFVLDQAAVVRAIEPTAIALLTMKLSDIDRGKTPIICTLGASSMGYLDLKTNAQLALRSIGISHQRNNGTTTPSNWVTEIGGINRNNASERVILGESYLSGSQKRLVCLFNGKFFTNYNTYNYPIPGGGILTWVLFNY